MATFEIQYTLRAANGVPQISPRQVLVPLDGTSTVGKTGSGATYEGADGSPEEQVFAQLWQVPDAVISGGTTGSPTTDWSSGKKITFPGQYALPLANTRAIDAAVFYLAIAVST